VRQSDESRPPGCVERALAMAMFLENWLSVLGVLTVLGLAGAFAPLFFQGAFTFPALLAPMFGMLFVTLGSLAFYALLGVTLQSACAGSWLLCFLFSCAAFWKQRQRLSLRFALTQFVLLLVVSSTLTSCLTSTSIRFGEPSLLYYDGSDHLGYASVADWLIHHKLIFIPTNPTPEKPYESYPNLMLFTDPRAGAFCFLALMSMVKNLSGAFTYDFACAVGLSCGILAVSATFARTRAALALLCLGLLTSHWFDYSRMGFFGKMLGFPATFFITGLFLVSCRLGHEPFRLAILLATVAGASILLSAYSTMLLLAVVGASFLLCLGCLEPVSRRDNDRLPAAWLTLALLLGVALLSSGTLSRPLPTNSPIYNAVTWDYAYSRIADLENQGLGLTGLNADQHSINLVETVIVWLILAIIAVISRSAEAVAVIIGPMLLLITLRLWDISSVAFQMIGIFYPFVLCGAAILIGDVTRVGIISGVGFRPLRFLVPWLVLVVVTLHIPRFVGGLRRWCLAPPLTYQFVRSQIASIARKIGNELVDVDLGGEPPLSIMVLMELGEDHRLQWSSADWNRTLGYRHWPVPSYSTPGVFRLVQKGTKVDDGFDVIESTNQYLLLKRKRDCP
jgi:hypothetical protein